MKKFLQNCRIAFSFLFITIVLYSCSKGGSSNDAIYLNTALKNYFEYQAGTYWVFYDSLNHHKDSLRIWVYSDVQPYHTSGQYDEQAGFEAGDYNPDSLADSLSWLFSLNNGQNTELTITYYSPKEIHYGFTAGMPFSLGISDETAAGYIYQCNLLPSYTINNTSYSSVYQISYLFSNSAYTDSFFINADHGFLKIILNDQYFHKSLYLVRDNIIH